jgi:Tol biopolymer transport system component
MTWLSAGRSANRLVWRDRAGREVGRVNIPVDQWGLAVVSPDGRRAVIENGISQGRGDLWVVDLEREIANRLTFGDGKNTIGLWSPDGREIMYQSTRKGPRNAYRIHADGSGNDRLVYESAVPFKDVFDWSPDGQWLTMHEIGDETGWNIYRMKPDGTDRIPFVVTPFNEQYPLISPDGRWMSYVSDESGTGQLYVQSFPEPGRRQQVTRTGAFFGIWGRNGREIIAMRPDLMLVSIPLIAGEDLRFGAPVELFQTTPETGGWDMAPDGRFLLVEPVERARPGISVAVNWREGREE